MLDVDSCIHGSVTSNERRAAIFYYAWERFRGTKKEEKKETLFPSLLKCPLLRLSFPGHELGSSAWILEKFCRFYFPKLRL